MEYELGNHLFSSNANAKKIVTDYIDHLAEVVYDITLNAQYEFDHGGFENNGGSRDLFCDIRNWAIDFISKEPNRGGNDDDDDYDYIEAIDAFTEQKMIENYGVMREFDVSSGDGACFRIEAKTAQDALRILSERVLASFKSQLVQKVTP